MKGFDPSGYEGKSTLKVFIRKRDVEDQESPTASIAKPCPSKTSSDTSIVGISVSDEIGDTLLNITEQILAIESASFDEKLSFDQKSLIR